MAFLFNSTPKDPTANSYISVEQADAFAFGNVNGQTWLDLTQQQKEALLVQSTYRIDLEGWSGSISDPLQSLQWPRAYIINRNGKSINRDVVPTELQQATFALAYHYLNEFLENPTVSRQDMDRLSALTIGPLSMTINQRKEDEFPDMVKRLLKAIGDNVWIGASASIKLYR